MPHTKPHAFTTYGCALCFWILVTSFQYGYHISSLNQIQAVLTCKITLLPEVTSGLPQYSLPTCIPMSDFAFSIITSVFTIGGLVGSLVANIFMDGRGRKGAVIASSILTAIGSAFMGVVSSVVLLSLGRFVFLQGISHAPSRHLQAAHWHRGWHWSLCSPRFPSGDCSKSNQWNRWFALITLLMNEA